MARILLVLVMLALASAERSRADTFTLYGRTLADSDITGWDYETNILGAPTCDGCSDCCYRDNPVPSRIQCSAGAPSNYPDVQIVINGWSSWNRPAGHVVTRVTVSFFGAFAGGVSGNVNLRFNGGNRVQRSVGGNCGWEPAYDITFLQPDGWSNAEINGLDVSIARASGSPSATLHVDAVRLVVTTAATGACCFSAGTCAVLTSSDCAAQAGVYQGNNAACNPCPQPTGRCCFASGACTVVTGTQCAGSGGTYAGDNTGCSPNPCLQPTGRCCLASGACTVVTGTQCSASGGTYAGDNTGCSPNPCPQPTGRCCFASGACTVVIGVECYTSGGTFAGTNTSCTPNVCPQPGRCCAPSGACSVVSAAQCASAGGAFGGNGTTCSVPCPAPTGACCYLPYGGCAVYTAAVCADSNGTYRGDGVSCTPALCPSLTGACCLGSAGCVVTLSETCTGLFLGVGSECGSCLSIAGACCDNTGMCRVQTLGDCVGLFRGFGLACNVDTCADVRYACMPDGACQVREPGDGCSRPTDQSGCEHRMMFSDCASCALALLRPTQLYSFGSIDLGAEGAPGYEGGRFERSGNGSGGWTLDQRVHADAETSGGLGPPQAAYVSGSASAQMALSPNTLDFGAHLNLGSLSAGDGAAYYQCGLTALARISATVSRDVIMQPPPQSSDGLTITPRQPGTRIGARLLAGEYEFSVGFGYNGSAPPLSDLWLTTGGVIEFVPSTCRPDIDGNIGLSVNDLFAFMAAFFSPGGADYNRSGSTSVEDLFALLADYFAGCP